MQNIHVVKFLFYCKWQSFFTYAEYPCCNMSLCSELQSFWIVPTNQFCQQSFWIEWLSYYTSQVSTHLFFWNVFKPSLYSEMLLTGPFLYIFFFVLTPSSLSFWIGLFRFWIWSEPKSVYMLMRLLIMQSGQNLCYRHEETLHPRPSKMHPLKILIRLRGCAGWSEPSLGAHVRRNVLWHCS